MKIRENGEQTMANATHISRSGATVTVKANDRMQALQELQNIMTTTPGTVAVEEPGFQHSFPVYGGEHE